MATVDGLLVARFQRPSNECARRTPGMRAEFETCSSRGNPAPSATDRSGQVPARIPSGRRERSRAPGHSGVSACVRRRAVPQRRRTIAGDWGRVAGLALRAQLQRLSAAAHGRQFRSPAPLRMRSLFHFVPGTRLLVMLFSLAKQRLARHTDGVGKLSEARITSATEELNQIADDIRDAEAALEPSLPTGSQTNVKSPGTVDAVAAGTPAISWRPKRGTISGSAPRALAARREHRRT
jgi:hypothetical protein